VIVVSFWPPMVAVTVAPGMGWFADFTDPLWAKSAPPVIDSANNGKERRCLANLVKMPQQATTTPNRQPLPC
jgi:hypothetical protein